MIAAARLALIEEARALLSTLRWGNMSATAYDTAWVARLRDPADPRRLLFPETAAWLLSHQWPDGSWGGHVETLHDRCISTLASILTLTELAGAGLLDLQDVSQRVGRGVSYLWQRAAALRKDPHETVGFELLFPPLLARAQRMGLELPYGEFLWVWDLREAKLRLVPGDLYYAKTTTLVHSLEFLGDNLDVARARGVQAGNGSYGNSPSATAYVLGRQWDPAAYGYLRAVAAGASDGGTCNVYPFEVFEKAWVLDNLQSAGLTLPEMAPHLVDLHRAWSGAGVGISAEGLPADSDDTSLALKVLRAGGYDLDTGVFGQYEGKIAYLCFPFERNPSISANVHILAAVKDEPRGHAGEIRRIVNFLEGARHDGAYWSDKWHASPYYATGHAVMALVGVRNDLVADAVEWFVETQHSDGSWGAYGGSCEETAYVVQALLEVGVTGNPLAEPALDRGAAYLVQARDAVPYPELWIGKGLYTPGAVVKSAILGALLRYSHVKGGVRK